MFHPRRTVFSIITLFPEIVRAYSKESILRRALDRGLLEVRAVNPRDFARDRRRTVDDRPYGGGPGMVLKAEPLARAVIAATRRATKPLVILLSPAGEPLNAAMVQRIARNERELIFVAGRYEGIDERLKNIVKGEGLRLREVSIGPFVVTGGELPALIMVDAIARYLPGVLGKEESREELRHGIGVPVYTRPETIHWRRRTYRVPRVLVSGNHAAIEAWRNART